MNYEMAAAKYIETRNAIDAMEREHKERKAELVQKLVTLENWFTAKAQEDGLSIVKTSAGTGYWSTHHTATVASREDFFAYCKENDTWDMVEARASKTGVKSFIEAKGAPPPGINFASAKVFNFRKSQTKEP